MASPLQPVRMVPLTTQEGGLSPPAVLPPTLIVASTATPSPLTCTTMGSALPSRFVQFRPFASKVATKRCARKVKRFVAAAASGEGRSFVRGASSCIRVGAILNRLLQYIFVPAMPVLLTGGWFTPIR